GPRNPLMEGAVHSKDLPALVLSIIFVILRPSAVDRGQRTGDLGWEPVLELDQGFRPRYSFASAASGRVVPRTSGYGQYCPLAMSAEILGGRWTMLVIRELLDGSTGFNEIA